MRRLTLAFAAALLCAIPALPQSLTIRNVTLIDGTGAPARLATIEIRDGRIVSAGPSAAPRRRRTGKQRPAPPVPVIDGRGKFAIPALWDMHVHLWDAEPHFRDYLKWGVAGVRDMGSDFERTSRWRSDIARHRLIGPYIYTSGQPVNGAPSREPKLPVIEAPTPAQAQVAVDLLYDRGVDYVKVLSGLDRESYFALAQRCRVRRLMFAGHLPKGVTVEDAIRARQSSMEHLFGLIQMPAEDRVRIFADLRTYEVWQTPTLTLWKRDAAMSGAFAEASALTLALSNAGVPLLAGTDTGDPGVKPGEALHEELELLVGAGLTPIQALQTATRNAALWFGEEAVFGTIQRGRRADVLLLNGDPLRDIRNTRRIYRMIMRGRVVSTR